MKRPINSILALDPGIRATHMIDQQLQCCQTKPADIFQFATISRYSFIAATLTSYLRHKGMQMFGDDVMARSLDEHELYKSMEGEPADVTRSLIDGHRQKRQSTEFLDLVLYTGYLPPKMHKANALQLLKNVYQLLRTGGGLLIGFPPSRIAENVAFHELLLMADQAGFAKERSRIHIGVSNAANARLPLFAFFEK